MPSLVGSEMCIRDSNITGVANKRLSTLGGDRAKASPEFRLLGPSACSPLVGCPESMRQLAGQSSANGGGSVSSCGSSSRFRPETLMKTRTTRLKRGERRPHPTRKKQNNNTHPNGGGGRGVRAVEAAAAAAAAGGGRLHHHIIGRLSEEKKSNFGVLDEKRKISKLTIPGPPLPAPADESSESGDSSSSINSCLDSASSAAGGKGEQIIGRFWGSSISSSLSTQSSSSGMTRTAIAETLRMWDRRELAAAERAVSARPERRRLCDAFRTRESTLLAGMTAAQRAYRGGFVMSKMGDARARSSWRP